MKDVILVPYAPNLIESTRSIGYSFETALADIIDNSISNFAKKIDVKFRAGENPYVAIIDNGDGMTCDELEKAMQYGSASSLDDRNENDLGRFGLGLKMASMSQCRKLTVISKKNQKLSAACWDLDYIHETQNWSLIRYSESQINLLKFIEELKGLKSGTIVLWEKLDRISESSSDFEREFNDKLDFADKHTSLVFHRYLGERLSKKYVEIFFNNRKLNSIDPFMTNNGATQPLEEETIFINRNQIKVKPFITPYSSKLTTKERKVLNDYIELNLNQGLYIYRNQRLIVWGSWFRIFRKNELSKLAKVRIDLPNSIDEIWKIDVKKSSAAIPSMIKEQLKHIIERTVGKSERVYKYRGRKVNEDNYEHIWNKVRNRDKVQYLINKDIPMYKSLENSLNDGQQKLLDNLIRSLEDSFPFMSVYYDVAKDQEIEDKSLSTDEAYSMAKESLRMYAHNITKQKEIIMTLKKLDIFIKYPEVIKLIEKEYLDE